MHKNDEQEALLAEARQVLLNNRLKGYTIPAAGLYPFQWNWDSAFISIGLAYFDLDKAIEEMQTLFKAQWSNGFLPHIVFWDKRGEEVYFPSSDFYQTTLSPHANEGVGTSGLTQPPIHGFTLEYLLNITDHNPQVEEAIRELFPKVYAYHEYLYTCRDPEGDGLVYINHNWESGTDNSPAWDGIFEEMATHIPKYDTENLRKDTQHVDKEQRPHNREYDCYLYLVDLQKECGYDDQKIYERSPFIVYDPLFNSLLSASNEALIRLAPLAGHADKIPQLEAWNEKTRAGMNRLLWMDDIGCYAHYDCKKKQSIGERTSSGFAALLTTIPNEEQQQQLVELLGGEHFAGSNGSFLCPSFDRKSPRFEPQRYWRGPVWINMNWLILRGLEQKGYSDLAQRLRRDTLEILEHSGFYEYFEPGKAQAQVSGGGYGGKNFSWSAALYIDLLKSQRP